MLYHVFADICWYSHHVKNHEIGNLAKRIEAIYIQIFKTRVGIKLTIYLKSALFASIVVVMSIVDSH